MELSSSPNAWTEKNDQKVLGTKPQTVSRCVWAFRNIIPPKWTERKETWTRFWWSLQNKLQLRKRILENILITNCDFLLSNKTSAICITTDTSTKTRLTLTSKKIKQRRHSDSKSWNIYADGTQLKPKCVNGKKRSEVSRGEVI